MYGKREISIQEIGKQVNRLESEKTEREDWARRLNEKTERGYWKNKSLSKG